MNFTKKCTDVGQTNTEISALKCHNVAKGKNMLWITIVSKRI